MRAAKALLSQVEIIISLVEPDFVFDTATCHELRGINRRRAPMTTLSSCNYSSCSGSLKARPITSTIKRILESDVDTVAADVVFYRCC